MPTILLKKSDTPSAVPTTANLTNLAGGVEVAVNTADKRMFTMNSSSAVVELGTNPSSLTCADASFTVARVGSLTISSLSLTNATFASATITNLTSTSATISSALTLSGGTANGVLYLNGSKVATSGSALTFDGTNLGVGTSPVASYKIAVNGDYWQGNGSGTLIGTIKNASGWYEVASSSNVLGVQLTSAATTPIRFLPEGSEAMRLTSTGLGIGTSSPAGKLHVSGQTRIADSANAANYILIGAGANAPRGGNSVMAQTGSMVMGTEAASNLIFITNAAEAGRFDSSGKLGIGTSTPAARVHSVDTSGYSLGLSGSTKGIRTEHNSTRSIIQGVDNTLNVSYQPIMLSGSVVELGIAGVVGATLDASGNLGLGVTPSAWQSGAKALEIGGNGYLSFTGSTSGGYLYNNAYLDAAGNKYKASGYANALGIGPSGEFRFFTAPSGTAGDAITFTQAMTLTGGSSTSLKLATSATGSGASDGFDVIMGAASDAYLYNRENGPLIFGTNDTERARITSGGNLLVGTTTASDRRLSVSTNATSVVQEVLAPSTDSATVCFADLNTTTATNQRVGSIGNNLGFWTGGTERARITSGGDLLVGNTASVQTSRAEFTSTSLTPAFLARVNVDADEGQWAGQFQKKTATSTTSQIFVRFLINDGVTASGYITANGANAATFTSSSDSRLKENIAELPSQWGSIKALRPVEFDYIQSEGGGHQVGFVAQDFEQVYPDSVGERPDGMKMLSGWSKTEARMVKALQEAMARIEKLEAEVAALKGV